MPRSIPIAAALLALLAAPAAAQQQTQPCAADSAHAAGADVVIRASVQANELRFDAPPQARLQVLGCDPARGLRVVERRNLPERMQPGVTYRDVYVAVEIVGRLNAACIAALAGDSTALRQMAPGACVPAATRADGTRAPP